MNNVFYLCVCLRVCKINKIKVSSSNIFGLKFEVLLGTPVISTLGQKKLVKKFIFVNLV